MSNTKTCTCARHTDGSVTTTLCSIHAKTDPCLTMATVTGKRRTGTIKGGVCSSCGWESTPSALTWTRGKAATTYHMGGAPRTVVHTTHTTTLSSGAVAVVTSVEGSFFLDIDGTRRNGGTPFDTLGAAKAAIELVEKHNTAPKAV